MTMRMSTGRSFVASERLGLEPSAFGAILENVGDADGGLDPLDPALHQREVGVVAQAKVVQSCSLGPGDVTGRRIALRVRVCVMPVERLPVLVTGPFERLSKLLPGECHGFSFLFASLDQGHWRQRYPPSTGLGGLHVWPGADCPPGTKFAAARNRCGRDGVRRALCTVTAGLRHIHR